MLECRSDDCDSSSLEELKSKFPNLHKAAARVVDLHAGDVLYIPPYWSHRVEAHTLCLSLSITSPSLVETIAADAYWHPVPFGNFQNSTATRVTAIIKYFDIIFSAANTSTLAVATNLYYSRYRNLFPEERLETQHAVARDICATDAAAVQTFNSMVDKFDLASANVVNILSNGAIVEDAIKIYFFRDYMEQISRWAVGPERTPLFIYKCLAKL